MTASSQKQPTLALERTDTSLASRFALLICERPLQPILLCGPAVAELNL
jgi:hypothetical protein